MAESSGITASFPLPPMHYVLNYTDDNIRKGKAPKPPPPMKDNYVAFGVRVRADDQIIQPLESQPGLRRLHPQTYDHKKELKKLNHSILANFLDLLDILIKNPGSKKRVEKIEDLTLLFIHMHHLVNEYRPHQARETLRVLLEVQCRQRLETAERFQKHLEKVAEVLQAGLNSLPDETELDTKLTIKMETCEGNAVNFGHFNGSVKVKQETDFFDVEQSMRSEQSDDEESINSLDRLMCDIIGQLNP